MAMHPGSIGAKCGGTPMNEDERPVTRPYILVEDMGAAVAARRERRRRNHPSADEHSGPRHVRHQLSERDRVRALAGVRDAAFFP